MHSQDQSQDRHSSSFPTTSRALSTSHCQPPPARTNTASNARSQPESAAGFGPGSQQTAAQKTSQNNLILAPFPLKPLRMSQQSTNKKIFRLPLKLIIALRPAVQATPQPMPLQRRC